MTSDGTSANIALTQPVPTSILGPTPLLEIYNAGSTDAFVAFGPDDTVEAVVPVPGTPGGFPIPAGKSAVVAPPPGSSFVASIGGTGEIFFTPGI